MDEPPAGDPLSLLRSAPLFQKVPEAELRAIVACLRPMPFAAGRPVIVEGEEGDACYVIASGEAGVVTRDLVGQEVTLATFGPGVLFGEIALVRNTPRTATVKALSDVQTLALRRDDFARLEASCPEFSALLRRHAEMLELDSFLHRASPFARLPRGAVRDIAERLRPVRVAAGEAIVREGERGDRFFLVRCGRVEILKGGRRLQVMEAGDYFGEVALLADTPRTATVRALEPTELLALDRATFQAVVQEHEAMAGLFAEAVQLRVGRVIGRAVAAADPRATLAPLMRSTRRGYWWKILTLGVPLFAVLSLVAAGTQLPALAYAAILVGAFMGPAAYVAYLAESNILSHPLWTILLTFLLGAALGIPVAIQLESWLLPGLENPTAALTIGVIEETAKLLGVTWLLRRAAFRFSLDGAVYGAAAGMGFAAFETLMYGLGRIEVLPRLLSTLWMRALLSPFGHGTWTAIICTALWGAKGSGRVRLNRKLVLAYALGVLLHGLWDWYLLPGQLHLVWLLAVGLVGVAVLGMVLVEAQREEARAVLALNPELARAGAQAADLSRVACRSCGQRAPPGAHYCARCGAALRM